MREGRGQGEEHRTRAARGGSRHGRESRSRRPKGVGGGVPGRGWGTKSIAPTTTTKPEMHEPQSPAEAAMPALLVVLPDGHGLRRRNQPGGATRTFYGLVQ